jgi:hypothetical protein
MVKAAPCNTCGHLPVEHWDDADPSSANGPCHVRFGREDIRCVCPAYENEVLPAPGSRLEFGKHRLPAAERDFGLPSDAEREADFRRWAQGAIKDMAKSDGKDLTS